MSRQSEKNYRFAEKNRWRLWAWRQIKKRLWERGVKTNRAKGLYLAAESDKDRDIACRKNGFRPENLIAVERDPETIETLKKKKIITVEGDVWEVISSMDYGYLNFLNLDLCNGFTFKMWTNIEEALLSPSRLLAPGYPICINLLRGRDDTVLLRIWKDAFPNESCQRGHLVLWIMLRFIENGDKIFKRSDQQIKEHLENTIQYMDPVFYSYRSDKVWMDSIVFNMPATIFHIFHETNTFSGSSTKDNKILKNMFKSTFRINEPMKRKITATKAIRTQRIQGLLPPCPSK